MLNLNGPDSSITALHWIAGVQLRDDRDILSNAHYLIDLIFDFILSIFGDRVKMVLRGVSYSLIDDHKTQDWDVQQIDNFP